MMSFLNLFFGFYSLIGCQTEFQYKSVHQKDKSGYTIELTLKNGDAGDYALELHDLNTGNLVMKTETFFELGKEKIVFSKVPPSTYTIYFSSTACNKKSSIKGKAIVLQ
jgi:hypothetical protein